MLSIVDLVPHRLAAVRRRFTARALAALLVVSLALALLGTAALGAGRTDRPAAGVDLAGWAVLDAAPGWSLASAGETAGGAAGPVPPALPPAATEAARGLLTEAFDLISAYSLRTPDPDALAKAAIEGMLRSLGDRQASYYTPSDFARFMAEVSGRYGGIGARVAIENGAVVIVNTIPGSPAERVGLLPGDTILAVDGRKTQGLALEAVADLIRGDPGTTVILTIARLGLGVILVEVVRDVIELISVESGMLDDRVGYMRILSFDDNTGREVRAALAALTAAGMEGLVLDLRDNPGGYLGEVLAVAENFVPVGNPVVYVDRGARGLQALRSYGWALDPMGPLPEPVHPQWPGPTVVLVNGRSASGAEILAGALQDWNLAVLVGSQTYGKGSVQTIFELNNHGGLRITTACYTSARGRAIEGVGLTPDVIVEEPPPPEPIFQLILLPTRWTYRVGHAGSDVLLLQARLRQLGYDAGPEDGVFGKETEAALKAFERRAGLVVDGVADPATCRALNTARLQDHPGGESASPPGTPGGAPPADPVLDRGLEVLRGLLGGGS